MNKAVATYVWLALSVSTILLVIGLTGLLINQPMLFASLGPTLYLQASDSNLPSARPYNVVLGHTIGLLAAYLALLVLGADPAHRRFLKRISSI